MRSQRRAKRRCCPACNSQILCSYVLALLSTALVVGGGYLAVKKWDHTWLILSTSGVILMLIGSCMYYCGNLTLAESLREEYEEEGGGGGGDESGYRRRCGRSSQKLRAKPRCYNDRGSVNEVGLSDSRSVSQLSLNMIPQYFSNAETSSPQTNGAVRAPSPNLTYSQIFSVNGQSFLILPLSGDNVTSTEECSIPMQNLFLKIPHTVSNSSVRKKEERPVSRTSSNVATPRQPPRRNPMNVFDSHCLESQRFPASDDQNNTSFISTYSGNEPAPNSRRTPGGIDVNMRAPSSSRLKRKRSQSETARNQLNRHSAAIVSFVHETESNRSRSNAQANEDEAESYTPSTTENTPLIPSCSYRGQAETSETVSATVRSLPSTSEQGQAAPTFPDEISPVCEAVTGAQASTPPPSYEEVLSVDQETEITDCQASFGTV